MQLNLDRIPQLSAKQAVEAFHAGDATGFVCSTSNDYWLEIVFNNLHELKRRGIYEEALLVAFTGCRVNNYRWMTDVLRALFSVADKHKLRKAGDELPAGEEFNIYRGVAGKTRARRCSGLSWTLNLDVACWFAHRSGSVFGLGDEAVIEAVVPRGEVLAYVDDGSEEEVIVFPPRYKQTGLSEAEIARRFEAWKAK